MRAHPDAVVGAVARRVNGRLGLGMSRSPESGGSSRYGAAQESNLPSVGLPRLTGFEGMRVGVR
jgi:hypothetical protein